MSVLIRSQSNSPATLRRAHPHHTNWIVNYPGGRTNWKNRPTNKQRPPATGRTDNNTLHR